MLKLQNVTVSFGKDKILDNFSCDLSDYKIIAICGPSGCGKTTLLNAICSLVPLQSGKIETDLTFSYMFQEPRLFPWLTAVQNVNVCLSDGKDTEQISKNMLAAVGITDFNKYPHQLSGGMQQRVSFARALCFNSDALVLDEPFSALDADSKKNLLDVLSKEKRQIIFVTHDADDTKIADYVINL